ncbi:MAG: ATP-binding protein [Bacteroidales bacterium]|nr:ATP-binding protein [Bacteroidales bacterium]MDD4218088.1 ATP-binding protein [Bacteroidales bacterium]
MNDKFAKLERLNFWNNKLPFVGLKRFLYLNKIEDFIGNKLVKVLVGQRRVGKSYLLRQIILSLIDKGVNPKNIIYINKEYTDFDFISDYVELEKLIINYKEKMTPQGKVYLFIDEIQNIIGWERLINSYSQDFVENYEIFITGSNSELLSGELATLLSGRYIQFEIFPFCFSEYTRINNLELSKASYMQFMQTGGLPDLYNLPNDETKMHYLSAIRDTILLRDIVSRYNIKDPRLLSDIFAYLINNVSNLISINNIVNYFISKNRKTNYETIANYIQYLQNSFLIHRVERYNIKGKDIVSGTNKYYINDLSFKNYLYSGFNHRIGYLLENLVYSQLRVSGFTVYTGAIRNKEIDFIATKASRKIYVQVSYLLYDAKTIEREYSELEKIRDNYEKIVVSLDDIKMPSRNGINHLLAWQLDDFLR